MRKFQDISPPVISEQRGTGDDYGTLVRQVNQALTELTDKVNRCLQGATGFLSDFPLWGKCEVVTVYPRDRQPTSDGKSMVAVRHNLGAIPQYAIPMSKGMLKTLDPAVWYLEEAFKHDWTDTHVYFQVHASLEDYHFYRVLLLA
jgi:hypothetical protein